MATSMGSGKDLEGLRILVTGASRGIGRAIALECARRGASVVVHYGVSVESAEAVAEEVRAAGSGAALVHGDWENADEVRAAASAAWDAFGGLDVLVNNAGINYKRAFLESDAGDFERLWKVNVMGPFVATKEIAGRMIAAGGGGRVLTVTSVNGLRPGLGFSVYGATKGALELMMKGAALELAPFGVLVNTLAVGAVATDMNRDVTENPESLRAVEAGVPVHRMGSVEEIAALACGLLRRDNSYMTGATVTVDGGLLLTRGYASPHADGR